MARVATFEDHPDPLTDRVTDLFPFHLSESGVFGQKLGKPGCGKFVSTSVTSLSLTSINTRQMPICPISLTLGRQLTWTPAGPAIPEPLRIVPEIACPFPTTRSIVTLKVASLAVPSPYLLPVSACLGQLLVPTFQQPSLLHKSSAARPP